MAKLTLPEPAVALGRCPHCGAEIKITDSWYRQLMALLRTVNAGIP